MAIADNVRARVFISCGQSKGTDEVQIADAIAAKLRTLGFEPYIAVGEQNLAGLTENIYNRLRNSEYFLFVDFKREPLVARQPYPIARMILYLVAGIAPPQHRGSLFFSSRVSNCIFP